MKIVFKRLPDKYASLAKTNVGLSSALNRLTEGTPDTPRSWFYEDHSPEWILESVVHQLKGSEERNPVISGWDLNKASKFGPQGGSAPLIKRIGGLEEYYSHLSAPSLIKDLVWKRAKDEAVRRLGFNRSGEPTTPEKVIARGISEDRYNTNSGAPLWIRRKNKEAIESALALQEHAIDGSLPFTLGTRASIGHTHEDARNIFMSAMATNIFGQRYQQPLQDYLRSTGELFFRPWEGWEATQDAISKYWVPEDLKFGADYTKMDQHFNLHHGLEVYDVIRNYFKPQYWDELRSTITYVFRSPLITNLGWVDQESSMKSGSEWTNFLETVWNYIFTIYLELKYQLKFTAKFGIGDDQLWLLKGQWTEKAIKWVTQTVLSEFEYAGLPGNPDKQEVSMTVSSFLQRLLEQEWLGLDGNQNVPGVYSLIRNVTSETYPEFFHNPRLWDWRQFVYRVLMICENTVNHPNYPWYVKFTYNSNRHIREFMLLEKAQLDAIQMKARSISNFVPNYVSQYGDISRKPIYEFRTYKAWIEQTTGRARA